MITFLVDPKKELSRGNWYELPKEIPFVESFAEEEDDDIIKTVDAEDYMGKPIDKYIFTGKKEEIKESALRLIGDSNDDKWVWLRSYRGTGDIIVAEYMSHIAKNPGKAGKIILELFRQGNRVVCLNEKFDSDNLYQIEMLSYMQPILNLFYKGDKLFRRYAIIYNEQNMKIRKKAYAPYQFPEFRNLYSEYKEKRLTKKAFAEQLKVSRPTLDKLISAYEEKIG